MGVRCALRGSGTFKYFMFSEETPLTLCIRGRATGHIAVFAGEKELTQILVLPSEDWVPVHAVIDIQGTYALRFLYEGTGVLELKEFSFDIEDMIDMAVKTGSWVFTRNGLQEEKINVAAHSDSGR